jgi:hypothetical protein
MVTMASAGEELFNLSGDPTEFKNCGQEPQPDPALALIWFDLKCRLYRWKQCVQDNVNGPSCETSSMTEAITTSGGCPTTSTTVP